MSRPLSAKEKAVLTVMIESGTSFDDEPSNEERRQFLTWVDKVEVTGACGCTACESVELGIDGTTIECSEDRYVLSGDTEKVMVLLFVDDGKPSYLEVAATDGVSYAAIPEADEITFPTWEPVDNDMS